MPVYQAVDVLVDHGSRHFESYPGMPKLADKIDEFLSHWQVDHVIVDASGVGQGLASVSYTHLDVYKRQQLQRPAEVGRGESVVHDQRRTGGMKKRVGLACLLYTSRCV